MVEKGGKSREVNDGGKSMYGRVLFGQSTLPPVL